MSIESNFNKNLKTSVRKHSSTLPSSNKFILHSLLKNLDEVEDMLENDNLVEYKVGDIKNVVKSELRERAVVPGETVKSYGTIERPYNFKSQGASPMYGGEGYNFESQGPLGVNYYEGEEEEVEDILERTLNEAKKCDYSFECKGDKICKKGRCRKCKDCKGKKLKGDQHKLDMNKNGELDSEDFKMLGNKQETEEATTTASAGAYMTPRFWAKNKRKSKNNHKRLMPGAKFVRVKDKCKKFPYCNQGDISALELWEKKIMSEAAKNVSKKTGVSEDNVKKMVEKELAEIIRRTLYKSPVTDLVGTGKMDTPIGKIFTMDSNVRSKYES